MAPRRQQSLHLDPSPVVLQHRAGCAWRESPEREDSPGKMATAGSAERPGRPVRAAGSCGPGSGPVAGSGPGSSPAETETRSCPGCTEGPPACPRCPARRHPDRERLRRRSEPERSGGRAGRREFFVSPAFIPKSLDGVSAASVKHKPLACEDREEAKRRSFPAWREESARRLDEPGVLSDSENEEPISRRIRNISAFIRKTKNFAAFSSGSQRSQSCTDSVEDRGGKLKVVLMDKVGISHSFTAGILLSSENSRSVSAPITAPDRRLTWRAVITSSSTPPAAPLPRPERSISPESNDSISEELNHFKPIVCSPCTPPKRLPDGRVMEPTIVKATPRNLTRGLQRATTYEASPAVLQKWRQIELDRQSLQVSSRATLTSPVRTGGAEDEPGAEHERGGGKPRHSPAGRDGDVTASTNKRKLLFDPLDSDVLQKQTVKIRVPAIRYSEVPVRGRGFEATGAPECGGGGGGAFFSRRQSFSPYTKNSGFTACKLVPKDSQRESDRSLTNQSTSKRGRKREQKTKHLDPDHDLKRRRRPAEQEDERRLRQVQQERQDRALALRLQRQFDRESLSIGRSSPDAYFLRSWMSNQNRRRRGLRRSRRINKKH